MTFEGKSILITGASSGIGEASSVVCAKLGANVILSGRDTQRLEDVRKSLSSGEHSIIAADLKDGSSVSRVLIPKLKLLGGIDGWVHSAGVHKTTPIQHTYQKVARDLFDTNVFPMVEITHQLTRNRLLNRSAAIVFISSVVAHFGQPGVSSYAASKGATESFAKSIALELAPQDIRVNCIAAGIVSTPLTDKLMRSVTAEHRQAIEKMHPLGFGKPQDVADSVAFLLTSPWITGTTLFVDGGYSAK